MSKILKLDSKVSNQYLRIQAKKHHNNDTILFLFFR